MAEVVLRQMNEAEAKAFRKFSDQDYLKHLLNLGYQMTEAMERLKQDAARLDKDPGIVYLSIDSDAGEVIGGFIVGLQPTSAFLFFIYIDEAFREKGWGKKAMHALADELKSQGIPALRLSVAHENEVARKLYDNQGFRPLTHTMQLDL